MKAQKYLLGAFEQLVGNVHKDTLMPKVAHILKSFYDHDVIDEEVSKPAYITAPVHKQLCWRTHVVGHCMVRNAG